MHAHTMIEESARAPSGEWVLRTSKGEVRAEQVVNAKACKEAIHVVDFDCPDRPVSSGKFGAGDEIRTHDPYLGKVMLYP